MPNDLLKLLLVAAVAYVAYNVLLKDGPIKNQGTLNSEVEEEHSVPVVQGIDAAADKHVIHGQIDDVYKNNPNVLDHPQMSNSNADNFAQLDCFPKDQTQPQDLLPPDGGFAESNPATQGQLMNRNLFEAGHHAGLNTQSNSLRNGNRQIRSDPLIPRQDVGPWHQSTYDGDTNRRTFEIGSA